MQDVLDIIKNIDDVYGSNTSFQVLKDFERVIDELDIYVYSNWAEGELAMGPKIEKHWVTCSFMWPRDKMPDPKGGKRLLDYDCKVRYKKDHLLIPREIRSPDDLRPGTKKGKLDRKETWLVEIQMPVNLIRDIYSGYLDIDTGIEEPDEPVLAQTETEMQTADETAVADQPVADQGAAV